MTVEPRTGPSRRVLIAGAGAGAVITAGAGWRLFGRTRPHGSDGGADMARGHRLRDGDFPPVTREERADIIIAGGGVAGLSAGWALAEAGLADFQLLELENEAGGNARGGANEVSAYPLGAHYLPVPNREARALRVMLAKLGMITGEEGGVPVYDPYQLCADLQERLLWQGRWQEGLIPQTGLDARDVRDLAAFDAAMRDFSARVGRDGKPAFALPIAYSSRDPELLALDRTNFAAWLDAQRWHSPVLRAHVRYCCRDDYGCEPRDVSAWAGIHYFAGRRGWAANGAGDNVLTWPEGNARLTRAMTDRLGSKVRTGHIVFRAVRSDGGVEIDSFDTARGETLRTYARAAILAMPHFVAHRVAPEAVPQAGGFSYAPWLVANVTVERPPRGRGAKLAWDNVSATGEGLGYVVATHQQLGRREQRTVLTWYRPLSELEPAQARRLLVERSAEDWRSLVVQELLRMNPDLEGAIRRVDIWRWGHAMIRPVPGFVWGRAREADAATRAPFFLAHSDLGGLSLFEEAHYRGTLAAERAMHAIGHAFESML